MQSYRPLTDRYSTADADRPSLEYRSGDLVLHYVDWRESAVRIRFPAAVAFRWQDEAFVPAEIRDDQSYEVVNSNWLAELLQSGVAELEHRHYMLCFNAHGVLDVISHAAECL